METRTYEDHDDRRALVSAVGLISRLDEAILRSPEVGALQLKRAEREEAVAIAAMDGHPASRESLARLLADPEATMMERGVRAAADAHRALALAAEWRPEGPSPSDISDLFVASDASRARIMRPDMEWTLEDDSTIIAEEIETVFRTQEPWTAIEAIRRIWASGRFFGHSRRLAMATAPRLVAAGFGCARPFVGIADRIRREPDAFRDAAHDRDRWSTLMAAAMTEAATAGLGRLRDIEALRRTLATLCPNERSSSSVGAAIDYLIASPVCTARQLGEALGLTSRGTKVVIDKLVMSRVLDVEGGARNRTYVCRRAL